MPDERTPIEIMRGIKARELTEREQRVAPIEHSLIDQETGERVYTTLRPDIVDRVQSGQLKIAPSARVRVKTRSGDVRNLTGKNAQAAIDEGGYLLDTSGETREVHEETLESAYGDRPGLAALQGAASTATLGAFDVAARAVGQEESVREVGERSPIASTVGNIGGYLPALAVPGGGAASGARAAGTATKVLSKLPVARLGGVARAVEAGVAKKLGTGTLAKSAGMGIGGGVEGLGIGVATGIAEVSRSPEPVTMERSASVIKSHALFGGLVGSGGGFGLSLLGSAVGKTLGRTRKILDDARAPKEATQIAPAELRVAVDDYATSREGLYSVTSSGEKKVVTDQGKAITRGLDNPEGMARRPNSIRNALETDREVMRKAMENPQKALKELAEQDAALSQSVTSQIKEAESAAAAMPPRTAETWHAYRNKHWDRYVVSEGGEEAALRRINSEVAEESAEVAKHIRSLDKKWRKKWERENFKDYLDQAGGSRSEAKRALVEDWKPQFDDMLDDYYERVAGRVKLDKETARLWADWRGKAVKRGRRVSLEFDEAARFQKAITDGEMTAIRKARMEAMPDMIAKNEALYQRIEDAYQKTQPSAGLGVGEAVEGYGTRAAVGAMVGGAPGALALAIAPKVIDKLKGLVGARFAAAGAEAAGRGVTAIDAIMASGKKIARVVRPTTTKTLQQLSYGPAASAAARAVPTKSKALTAYRERSAELLAMVEPGPDGQPVMKPAARAEIAERLSGVAAADPVLADGMETSAARRVEYLVSKLPKRPDNMATQLGPDRWQPSEMEIASFARSAAAVEDPMSVLERVLDATITPEDADALRQVYPEMYEEQRAQIMAKIPELRETLPYSKRLSMSIFFNAPVDPSMDPGVIRVLQSNYATDPGTQGGTEAPQPSPQFGAVTKSAEPATAAQQRESQEGSQ